MEQRPGAVHYATATAAVAHGAPVTEDGFVGIAVKQIEAPPGSALPAAGATTVVNQVQVGEKFVIRLKGQVLVTNPGGALAKGAVVYIVPVGGTGTRNALTATTTNNLKFGRVEAIAGERGVGTGLMRVNMDAKDGF